MVHHSLELVRADVSEGVRRSFRQLSNGGCREYPLGAGERRHPCCYHDGGSP